MKQSYEDIIYLPHHVSLVHPQMSMEERAAQFSPFAALTGYGDVIRETARHTEGRQELSDSRQEELNRKLEFLKSCEGQHPVITITYFQEDTRKEGGSYITVTGALKQIRPEKHILEMEDGTCIIFSDILELESACFLQWD